MIIARLFLRTFELFLLVISLYVSLVFILSEIRVNASQQANDKTIPVYILSTGVHTDIILPLKNRLQNWSDFTSPSDAPKQLNYNKVGFGWGDKGFYLETPTWSDLKFSTAIKAMFGLSNTAMHVTFHNKIHESKMCKKIFVTERQYENLCKEIKASFAEEQPKVIANQSYGENDCFYNALGTYSLFKTCNTWTNLTLKKAGIKASLWTPYDKAVLINYP